MSISIGDLIKYSEKILNITPHVDNEDNQQLIPSDMLPNALGENSYSDSKWDWAINPSTWGIGIYNFSRTVTQKWTFGDYANLTPLNTTLAQFIKDWCYSNDFNFEEQIVTVKILQNLSWNIKNFLDTNVKNFHISNNINKTFDSIQYCNINPNPDINLDNLYNPGLSKQIGDLIEASDINETFNHFTEYVKNNNKEEIVPISVTNTSTGWSCFWE